LPVAHHKPISIGARKFDSFAGDRQGSPKFEFVNHFKGLYNKGR